MGDSLAECHDMPRLIVNEIAIGYDSFGPEDAEPILLISGLGTQMIRWAVPFCTALASHGYRVRFDNRDLGLSTHLDEAPPGSSAEVGLRSTKLPSVTGRLPSYGEPTIRPGSAGRSQPSPLPAIAANSWLISAPQRWSCTDQTTD